MASIDKIRLTKEQAREYWNWLLEVDDECVKLTLTSLVPDSPFPCSEGGGLILNYPEASDWYLWNYCPFDFVQEQLKEQYESETPDNNIINSANIIIEKLGEDFKLLEYFNGTRRTLQDLLNYDWVSKNDNALRGVFDDREDEV